MASEVRTLGARGFGCTVSGLRPWKRHPDDDLRQSVLDLFEPSWVFGESELSISGRSDLGSLTGSSATWAILLRFHGTYSGCCYTHCWHLPSHLVPAWCLPRQANGLYGALISRVRSAAGCGSAERRNFCALRFDTLHPPGRATTRHRAQLLPGLDTCFAPSSE